MFEFFHIKKKPIFHGLCDIHNHILPNIDDGSVNTKMSKIMIRNYIELGFDSLIPTPHIYKEIYPNTAETINKSYNLLVRDIEINKNFKINSPSAEYMVDEAFLKNLKNGKPKLLIKENYILIEINFFGEIKILESACFNLLQKNIKPILAHPERYSSIENISKYKDLKKRGFYFQLNILSLLGNYGKIVKKKSEELLKLGLYDFVATDAHNPSHLSDLRKLRLTKNQNKKWEEIREFQIEFISK
tara:strand:- start:18774 stop:19508 length:735 start_codon:yes stop_codon:yes gene_type:complete